MRRPLRQSAFFVHVFAPGWNYCVLTLCGLTWRFWRNCLLLAASYRFFCDLWMLRNPPPYVVVKSGRVEQELKPMGA